MYGPAANWATQNDETSKVITCGGRPNSRRAYKGNTGNTIEAPNIWTNTIIKIVNSRLLIEPNLVFISRNSIPVIVGVTHLSDSFHLINQPSHLQ